MRLTLLIAVLLLPLGAVSTRAGERPILHAMAKRLMGGAFVYGDGLELRQVPAPARARWRG